MRSLISQWSRAWAQRGRPPSSPFQSVMARKRMENSNRNAENFTNLQDTLDKKTHVQRQLMVDRAVGFTHHLNSHSNLCTLSVSIHNGSVCVAFFLLKFCILQRYLGLHEKKNQRCLLYSTAWKLCCENTQASKCILKSIFCHKFDLLVICLKERIQWQPKIHYIQLSGYPKLGALNFLCQIFWINDRNQCDNRPFSHLFWDLLCNEINFRTKKQMTFLTYERIYGHSYSKSRFYAFYKFRSIVLKGINQFAPLWGASCDNAAFMRWSFAWSSFSISNWFYQNVRKMEEN